MKISEALEAQGAAFTDTEVRDLHWRCHQLFAQASGKTKDNICRLHKKLLGLMLMRGFGTRTLVS